MSGPETTEELKARIIRTSDERGDFLTGDDGYVYYDPRNGQGFMAAWVLRHLADELDRRNAQWDAIVQADPRIGGGSDSA